MPTITGQTGSNSVNIEVDHEETSRWLKEATDSGELHRLFEEWERARKLSHSHPYLGDMLAVLMSVPSGQLSRTRVQERVLREREKRGHSIPRTFSHTVQSSYNRHCEDSKVFQQERLPNERPLFYTSMRGIWAVYRDEAARWLDRLRTGCSG